MKRPNNAGSVYKNSGKRRKPWVMSITLGYNDDGTRNRYTSTHATKKEAMEALLKYTINPTERPNVKFKEVYDEWSKSKYKKISRPMKEGYVAAYKKCVLLHNLKFAELRTSHFQNIIDEYALKQGRSALEKIRSLINQLYKYAMQNDICHKNYAQFLELPRKSKNKTKPFNDVELITLKKNDHLHDVKLILTMIYLGYRPTAHLELTVFNYDKVNKIFYGGIKTEAGIDRPVPIHSSIQEYVDYFLSLKGETVFCSPEGQKYSLRTFRDKHFYPALETLGLRRLTPRSCRDTFSSLCAMNNVDEIAHFNLMGHTDYAMSAENYTTLSLGYLRSEIEKIK